MGPGDAARALPSRDFQGTAVPLNDLLLPFLAFRKEGPGGFGGMGRMAPDAGPRRFDRSYSGEACGFKYSAPPGQGEKPNCGVFATATQYPRQWYSRGGHDARRELRQGLALSATGGSAPRFMSRFNLVEKLLKRWKSGDGETKSPAAGGFPGPGTRFST